MKEATQLGPKIKEPSEDEIREAKLQYQNKYDIFIPKSKLVQVLKLRQKLDWWSEFDPTEILSKPISEETATWLKTTVKQNSGKDISLVSAYDNAEELLAHLPKVEKKRTSDEIKYILIEYREILRDEEIEKKVTKLFRHNYGIELSFAQLEQIIPVLSRNLWLTENLDASLDKCLDDLLAPSDKSKDYKNSKSHTELEKAIDQVAIRLINTSISSQEVLRESD